MYVQVLMVLTHTDCNACSHNVYALMRVQADVLTHRNVSTTYIRLHCLMILTDRFIHLQRALQSSNLMLSFTVYAWDGSSS